MIHLSDPHAPQSLSESVVGLLPQLLSVVVGGAIGLIAAQTTNRAAEKRMILQLSREHADARTLTMQQHADELYMMFNAWSKMLTSHYMLVIPALTGTISYNDLLDSQQDAAKDTKDKFDFGRIEMLVEAYFPHLGDRFRLVLAARDALAPHLSNLRTSVMRSQFQPSSPDSLIADAEHFDNVSELFKRAIVAELVELSK